MFPAAQILLVVVTGVLTTRPGKRRSAFLRYLAAAVGLPVVFCKQVSTVVARSKSQRVPSSTFWIVAFSKKMFDGLSQDELLQSSSVLHALFGPKPELNPTGNMLIIFRVASAWPSLPSSSTSVTLVLFTGVSKTRNPANYGRGIPSLFVVYPALKSHIFLCVHMECHTEVDVYQGYCKVDR